MAITNRPNAGCARCAVLYSSMARDQEDLRGVAIKASAPRYHGSPPAFLLADITRLKRQTAESKRRYEYHLETEHKE